MAPAIIIALCVCSFNLSSCDSQHFSLNNHEIWLSRRWLKLAHCTFQLVKTKTKHKTSHGGSAGKGGGAWGFSGQCALGPHLLKTQPWVDEWAAFGGLGFNLHCCCIPAAPGTRGFQSPSSCGGEHHPEHLCHQLCLPLTFVATKHTVHKQTRMEILYPSTAPVCIVFVVAWSSRNAQQFLQ